MISERSKEGLRKSQTISGELNIGMKQMFISGSRDGWKQGLYRLKAQFLQLNSAGHFKRWGRLCRKGRSHVCRFFYMGSPVKTHVENGLNNIFNLRGQTIGVSDQAVITLKDSSFYDEEGRKPNTSKLLTES